MRKQIRKCIRDKQRSKRQETIQRILEEFRGIKNVSGIESAKKRVLIPKVYNDKGDTTTWREGIANVFGEFNSKLKAGNETEEKMQNTLSDDIRADDEERNKGEDNNEEIPQITDEEIQ